MSCKIKATTIFINKEVLLDSIKNAGKTYTISEEKGEERIYIPSLKKWGIDFFFHKVNDVYECQRERDSSEIDTFMSKLTEEYKKLFEIHKERLQKEIQELNAKRQQEIADRVKATGRQMTTETLADGSIKLIIHQ